MKKYLSICLKGLIIICGVYGVLVGLFTQRTVLQCLSYYTILSNVLTVAVMIYALVFTIRDADYSSFFKKGVTVCIMLTFLVYHFALRPVISSENFWKLSNFCLHYFVPLFTFADYLIFDKKGDLKPFQPAFWATFPIIYYCYILIYGAFGGYFLEKGKPIELAAKAPYWFLDTAGIIPGTNTVMGVKGVFISVILCTIGFLLLSYIMYGIDIALHSIKKNKS